MTVLATVSYSNHSAFLSSYGIVGRGVARIWMQGALNIGVWGGNVGRGVPFPPGRSYVPALYKFYDL